MRRGRAVWSKAEGYRGESDGGHTVVMDRKRGDGTEKGPSPKDLTLLSLGGCAVANVVEILEKMRQPLASIEVDMESRDTEEIPKIFDGVTMVYKITGEGLDPQQARRAVELTMDKYCGVSAMLEKATEIAWRVEVNGRPVQ